MYLPFLVLLIVNCCYPSEEVPMTNLEVVGKFLSSFINVPHAVIFLPNYKNGKCFINPLRVQLISTSYTFTAAEYGNMLSNQFILSNIVIPAPSMDITKILPTTTYAKCGVIIDMQNTQTSNLVLEQVGNKSLVRWTSINKYIDFQMSLHKYFNTSFPTLLINFKDNDLANIAPKIGFDSNMYMTTQSNDQLFEIFSFGLHLHNSSLQFKEVLNWTELRNYKPSYDKRERGNFHEIQLRGATVVNIKNVIKLTVKLDNLDLY